MTKDKASTIPIFVHIADCPTCKHKFENEIGCARSYCHGRIDYEPADGFVMYKAPPTIAQSIRNAAINWPQYLGGVECSIISSFEDRGFDDWVYWMQCSGMDWASEEVMQARTFMIFVAEALE